MEASTTFSRIWGKVWQDSGRVGRSFWERWSPYWCPKLGKGSNFEGCSCLTCPFQYWSTTPPKWRAVIHVDCSCNQSHWSMQWTHSFYWGAKRNHSCYDPWVGAHSLYTCRKLRNTRINTHQIQLLSKYNYLTHYYTFPEYKYHVNISTLWTLLPVG